MKINVLKPISINERILSKGVHKVDEWEGEMAVASGRAVSMEKPKEEVKKEKKKAKKGKK